MEAARTTASTCIAEINENNDIILIIIDIALLVMQVTFLLLVIHGLQWNLTVYHDCLIVFLGLLNHIALK